MAMTREGIVKLMDQNLTAPQYTKDKGGKEAKAPLEELP
jgi:hypothetical protein